MMATKGVIADLASAFEMANVEMLALAMPEARIVEATGAILRKWNTTRESFIGRQLVKYGTGPLSARHIQEDTEQGKLSRVEVTFVPPLGTTRTTLFTPQTWQDGRQSYMVLIGKHASAEQADNAVQNERRLSLALRSGGYAVWDHDYRTGQTFNSPEMYDLLGFERNSPELNFNSFNDLVHPDDRDKTLDGQIKSAPFGSDMFQTRYRVKGKGGVYVWIESLAGVIRNPVDGRPEKCVGLSRNIGDLMMAMERLQSSERVLKRSQEAARLGSFTISVDTGATRLSSEMITLIGMGDAIVQPNLAVFEKMIETADRERFTNAIAQARAGHSSPAFEIAYKTLVEGDLNYFEVKIEADYGKQGQVETIFGTCQCITARKVLERKFLQAQKMEAVGQLTGGVAHDFNNLLMVVIGNLQLVEALVKDDPRALKRIRAASEAAEKGSELTKRMLAFSRQQTLQNRNLDVNGLVTRMEGILSHAVGGEVDLRIVPGDDIWPVKADPTMLETAILNLCINARDAMKPKGGKLTIETANRILDAAYCKENEDVQPGDYVEIIVTDTGCGIAPENIEKVFQPFFTTKAPEAGSGLGLSMIYGFAKQSGGHIKIYSEVGHGTAMKMYLPRLKQVPLEAKEPEPAMPVELPAVLLPELAAIATLAAPEHNAAAAAEAGEVAADALPFTIEATVDETAEAAVAEPAPAPSAQADVPAKSADIVELKPQVEPQRRTSVVLVVEDNPSVRDVAAAMIEDMGFETLVAASGAEGLKMIEERRDIDLVLSDVIMAGGMNGPEMALHALKVRPELKVLFMSGYAPGSLRQMQEDLPNAVDLVNKPFTRNDLTEKVKRALAA
jgi:signal transduction histidine kinase